MSDSDDIFNADAQIRELELRLVPEWQKFAAKFAPFARARLQLYEQHLADLQAAYEAVDAYDYSNVPTGRLPPPLGVANGDMPFGLLKRHEGYVFLDYLRRALSLMRLPPALQIDILDMAQGNDPEVMKTLATLTERLNTMSMPLAQVELPVIDASAFDGLAGDFVRLVAPYSEASPVAILAQFLCAVGNLVGVRPRLVRGQVRHPPRIFVQIVGETSRARKGTSLDLVIDFMRLVSPTWVQRCVRSGLSTGQGVIAHLADHDDEDDDGLPAPAADRRLLLRETEFTAVLAAIKRTDGNLSEIIRQAFDVSGNLGILTKVNPITATGTHISIIGQTTNREYLSRLPPDEISNGFVNRFMHFRVSRPHLYMGDEAPDPAALRALAERVDRVVTRAATRDVYRLSPDADALWVGGMYEELESDSPPGALGDVIARNSTHVNRLALILAILAGSDDVEAPQLLQAYHIWQYVRASSEQLFGNRVILEPDEQRLLDALDRAGLNGMDGTQRQALWHRGKEATFRSRQAAAALVDQGLAYMVKRPSFSGLGRPADVLIHMKHFAAYLDEES